MSKKRLAALKSYQQLPADLRNAVALHLLHGLDGEEACTLVGRANGRRDWERQQIQTVLADFAKDGKDEDTVDIDALIAELDGRAEPHFIAPKPPTIAPGLPQAASNTVEHTPAPPETSQPLPVHEARCGRCNLVLCGCDRNDIAPTVARPAQDTLGNLFDVSSLFPRANLPCTRNGPSSVDLWRLQDQDEQVERERLIKILEDRQEQQTRQRDYELSLRRS